MRQTEPFGKYVLLGQVAIGGMAEIYKARYADPNMPQIDIAIKRILPSYTEDESFVTMFKDEGNIAIRLKHPNIVNIYEVGEVNNDWYIAMEYIHGTDMRILSDMCEKHNKRFTPTQVARIMCEISKALFYAHSCTADDGTPLNIVHRDCTPHNIMISNQGEVKLMDFGIAKAASRVTKTRVGTVKGKSSYMSPEQAKGKLLDGRSDMFTLGTVAWELLTGYRLFKAGSDFEILTKVLKSELIHPSDIDSNIPRSLGDIIMKTLERDREQRYATCGVLASTLDNWIMVNGDRSDLDLGNFSLALVNKQGHSINEIRDYVPGSSKYLCEDGNFVPKNGAEGGIPMTSYPPNNSPYPPPPSSYAPMPSSVPMEAAVPGASAGFPEPSIGLQAPLRKKVPVIYFVLFALLFAGACGFIVTASLKTSPDAIENVVFEAPEAFVTLKTHPSDATVMINGEVVKKDDGSVATTPIYSYPSRLGMHYQIRFEKKGYEPLEIERDVVLLSQDFDVTLKTPEEALAEKLDGVPEFVIHTDPEGALVKVNGEEMGKSPVTLKEVKFGTELDVEVSVENSKEYQVAKRLITVTRDGEDNVKIVAEKTSAAAPAPTQAVAAAAPSGGGTKTAQKTAPKKQNTSQAAASRSSSGGMGTISVKATPWATISIDSSRIGNTPISRKYKTGSHKVELRCPPKNKVVTKTVTVKADKTVDVGYNFDTNKWM